MSKLQIIHLFPFQQKIARKSKDWQIFCFSVQKMPYLLTKYRKLEQKSKQFQKSHFPHIVVYPEKFKQRIARKSQDIGKDVVFWSKKCHIYCPNLRKLGKNGKISQKSHFPHIAVNPSKFQRKIARKSKDIGKCDVF